MLVRHEQIVGFRIAGVVCRAVAKFQYWIHLYLQSVINNPDACMQQSVELNLFTAFRQKTVHFMGVGRHSQFLRLPFLYATFEIDDFEAGFGQHPAGVCRTAAATAIHGNRMLFRQLMGTPLHEIVTFHIDVYGTSYMA